jgi:hypothetical protein
VDFVSTNFGSPTDYSTFESAYPTDAIGGHVLIRFGILNVPQPFEQVQAMHMRSERDVGPVADRLAARAKNLFYEDEKRSL